MSTATKAMVKTPKAQFPTTAIKALVSSFKGKESDNDVLKILGISDSRAAEIRDWVECEGSTREAMESFTSDLKSLNEVAYAYYHFGQYTASN